MKGRTRQALALAPILWLAMALRFHQLGLQSFWNDEGNAARLAERSVRLIIKGAAMDIHPPGYYLLLHLWQLGAGRTEFALRDFSALCGLLTVAVVAALGRHLGGKRTGAVAALLLALHPLALYYAQEARMYALLGLVAALTLWTGTQCLQTRARWPLLAMGATVLLGLYTHYAYLFALAAVDGAFLIYWLLRERTWSALRRWSLPQGVALLLFLPWLPHLRKLTAWKPPDLAQSGAALHIAQALLVGITHPDPPAYLPAVALLLILWGTARTLRRRPFLTLAALLLVLLPPILFLATGSYRPAYLKFLLVSLPALTLLLAAPAGELRAMPPPHPEDLTAGSRAMPLTYPKDMPTGEPRAMPPACPEGKRLLARGAAFLFIAALLLPQTTALHHLYDDPAYRRDDYRGVAALIAAEGRPGDAIVLDAPNQWEVFTYYYRGPLEVFPAPYHPDEAEARAWLSTLLDGHGRLFVLYWGDRESDPDRHIERGLAERAYKAGEQWITSLRLARYGVAPLPEAPAEAFEARFGEAIVLDGATILGERFRAGDIIPVSLFWQAEEQPAQRYKLFVHLLNAEGQLVAQYDAEPVGGFRPTDGWQAGERIIDRCGVLVPAGLPAGRYTVRVGLYDFQGERLPVVWSGGEGDGLVIGTVEVEGE